MRLLLVELSRFRARRAIALILIAAALLTALLAATKIYGTRPVTAADRVAAQAQADRDAQQPWVKRELALCQKHPERYGGSGTSAADCEQMVVPQAENYLYRPTLNLKQEQQDSGLGVLVIVSALMLIAGATFAGADWASGSMSNQLLFEPRRSRVWTAKAGAAFLGTLTASAAIVTAFWVALYLVAEARGIHTGATVQESIRWMAGRGVLFAGFAGLGGYALTMLLRHTVGTLAVMFAYAAGGETLIATLPIDGIKRFSLSNNVFAWLRDGYSYFDERLTCPPGGGECNQTVLVSLAHGATFLSVLLVLALVVSLAFFRRRDIP